jgi:pimeloyl-ACP methyl ester carboxylesterase
MRFGLRMGVVALATLLTVIPPVSGPAPAMSVAAAVEPYADQEIDWKLCFEPLAFPPDLPSGAEALECGSYRVPRDWGDPDAGVDLTIAVSRLRPPGGRVQRSLLTNPGGPGGAGRTLPLALLEAGRTRVLAHLEILGIDVRGTGDSTNVTCGNQVSTGASLDARDRRPQNTDLILDAADFIARACQSASPDLGPFITTEQTVRDLDLLRQLLGRERVSWLGYSGGTWLGAYYATYFPERVDRFVLDANVDFTAPWARVFTNQPLGFQRRFEVDFLPYVAAYDSYFGLGATPEEVNRAYEDLRAELAKAPLELEEALAVYPSDLDWLLARAIYSKRRFQSAAEDLRTLRDAVADRRKPDDVRTQLRRQALAADVRRARHLGSDGPLPLAPDARRSTFHSILCNDMPWPGDRVSLLADSQRLGESYPLIGWRALSVPCVFWNRPAVELRTPTGRGVPPVLMVQTERDPATPIEGALRAHRGFAGARLLTVVDEGDHGSYALGGNGCVEEVVEAYLLDGVLPQEGQTCPGEPIPPPAPVDDPSTLLGSDPLEWGLEQISRFVHLVGRLPL